MIFLRRCFVGCSFDRESFCTKSVSSEGRIESNSAAIAQRTCCSSTIVLMVVVKYQEEEVFLLLIVNCVMMNEKIFLCEFES